MPYKIRKGKGSKPYLIVNKSTGAVVGRSSSMGKAQRSIGYRMEGETVKKKRKK